MRKSRLSPARSSDFLPILFLLFLLLALDREAGGSPAVEAGFEMSHIGKPHLLQHVRRKGGPSPARSIEDDAFFRVHLAGVIFRRRV